MAQNVTTGFTDGSSSDAIQSFFNTMLLMRGLYPLVAQIPVKKHSLSMRQGKTMIWRRYETLALATTALTEGTTGSSRSKTKTDVASTLKGYGDYIEDTDFLSMTQPEAVETENVELLGQQMRETFDKLYMDGWAGQTTNVLRTNGSADTAINTKSDYDDYKRMYRTLKNNKAMIFTPMIMASQNIGTGAVMPSYWLIVSESIAFDLKSLIGTSQNYIDIAEYSKSQGVVAGEIGRLRVGFRVLAVPDSASEVLLDTGATGGTGVRETTNSKADIHSAFGCGQGALGGVDLSMNNGGIIRKPLGSAGTADALDQRKTTGWKKYDTRTILNGKFCAELKAAVST